MMCYYLNVHFQGQRVKGHAHECRAETLRRCRCVVRLRYPNLDCRVTTQQSCHNRQEELVFVRYGDIFLYIVSCKQEFYEKLISYVQSFPVIYDPNN